MGLFSRKPKPTHFRIQIKDVIYEMSLKEARGVMYYCSNALSAPGHEESLKNYVFEEYIKKKVKDGAWKVLNEGEREDLRLYVFGKHKDTFAFNWKYPSNTKEQIIIGAILASFLWFLTSGRLFGLLVAAFGVVSLLFGGIALGRDLEKDYSD